MNSTFPIDGRERLPSTLVRSHKLTPLRTTLDRLSLGQTVDLFQTGLI